MPDVGQLCGEGMQSRGEVLERRPTGQSADRCTDVIRSGGGGDVARTDQRRERRFAGLSMRNGVGQHVFLCGQSVVLVGFGDGCCGQLANLEPQQVDLARPRTLIATQRGQRCVDLGQPRPSRSQRFEIRRAEAIERVALRGRRQQALMGVLAVQVDGSRAPARRASPRLPGAR